MKKDTSWDQSAEWYEDIITEAGSYQQEVILPNLLRLMGLKKGQRVLDVGCGTGFFARAFAATGAEVCGLDNSTDMIAVAKKQGVGTGIIFTQGTAEDLSAWKNHSFDAVTIILALQNMERADAVMKECARVLKPSGALYVVLNHPAFRVPKESSWGWSPDRSVQFRRVDRYLAESKQRIEMHPGAGPKNYTISFHRPLQTYVKLLHKAGFGLTRLEEWISHRQGPRGKTFAALEQARKEIPLFMFFEAKKFNP